MSINRRHVLTLSAGAAAAFLAGGLTGRAHASADEAKALVDAFTGGAEPLTGGIVLAAPDTAENGNAVPVSVSVESAMEGDDMVEAVLVVADGNPRPDVATFHFSALSGVAAVTTRIRLAGSQTVTAVARMADGTFRIDRREIQVLVGGCTG